MPPTHSGPAAPAESSPSAPERAPEFADLGLHESLLERVAAGGYDNPTPIQARAIPALLDGRDVIGQAQTGTGKTAAFSLPMIQNLDVSRRTVQGLILCPTRELALQVSAALESYGAPRGTRVLTVYGGTPIHSQISQLRRGVHVVVGTPGRILDCIARRALTLEDVRHVVLDEADEMLRMGFIEDVEEILGRVTSPHQTALFTATLPPAIRRIAAAQLSDPVEVKIEARTRTVDGIDQRVLVVHADDKRNVLARLVESEPTESVLVFARTRASCARLVEDLREEGVAGAALHGDLGQDQREAIVEQLRAGRIQLVVATDIAARGLDVEGISHVINYDPPSEPETYVHRIGRTGRAGRAGVSVLLLTPRERRLQRVIESYTGRKMQTMTVPTNAELVAGRTRRLRARIETVLENAGSEPSGLDRYEALVDQMLAAPGADARRIAAALARLASRERPLEVTEPEPMSVSRPEWSRPHPRGGGAPLSPGGRRHGRGERSDRRSDRRSDHPTRGRDPRGPSSRRGSDPNMVPLFCTIGENAGLRPGDLVGAIANEAGVPGRAVGAIDIRAKVSFLEVAAEHAPAVLEAMNQVTIRGRRTAIVLARPSGPPPGRPRP